MPDITVSASGMTEEPSDGAATKEDRGGKQPPRLRLSSHAEPRGGQVERVVIFILKDRPAFRGRFSDLKRSIPGISQRMLSATVRNLERDGMLTRHVYAEVPPRVEYELTPLGRGLTEPVLGLVSWLQSNWPVIRSARDRFDARKKATQTVARPVASATIRG
jgi:DNA-binding HxlR family transcriptional regulator